MTAAPDRLPSLQQGLASDARSLLVELIELPSTHGDEAAVQQRLGDRWEAVGLAVESHPVPESIRDDPEYTCPEVDRSFADRPNLVVRLTGAAPGRSVIVNSHADVVPAADWPEAWTGRLEDDTVFGRGACDAKGSVVAMYLASAAMKRLGLPRGGEVIFQCVVDEEVGGNGSLALIREGMRADGAVVLEPTDLAMHPASRGALWFRFEFRGDPRHTGRKHEGVSAVDLACEAMHILYEYEKELVSDGASHPLFRHYEYPAQVNVGILRGGDFPSTVPARAVMEGVAGFLPNRPMDRVREDLVRCIEERGSRALRERYSVCFPKLHNDSFETPVDHPFVQEFARTVKETTGRDGVTGWNVSCDARLFSHVGGMPTVIFGPGRVEHAHSACEQVQVSDVLTAAETLVRFVERWCTAATPE